MTRAGETMQGNPRAPALRILEITGGVKVACPSASNLITPYVLEEQGDWFEDEIRFMRAIIEPDGVFIDIGANYGLYSLAAARLSPRGRVWSYEPAMATAACLTRSIDENRFDNITLTRQAVSDRMGAGWLRDMGSPELNVVGGAGGEGPGEPITLTTLDHEMETHGWTRADIVKIDVEGHEASVIAGGRRFFSELSPLVMLEVKSGPGVDMGAARRLVEHGYHCWRLVPGLPALVPQALDEPVDDYLLNLFCCKPDKANMLARANRLAQSTTGVDVKPDIPADGWQARISTHPYARDVIGAWSEYSTRKTLDGWDAYREALDGYAFAMDPAHDIDKRFAALRASHAGLRTLLKTRANAPRLLSFARIAADFGARLQAVEVLRFLLNSAGGYTPADFQREPWLSPSIEFDTITPHGSLSDWALSAAYEAFERLRGFSSFFLERQATLAITDELARRGYLTPAMQRRARLVRDRLR